MNNKTSDCRYIVSANISTVKGRELHRCDLGKHELPRQGLEQVTARGESRDLVTMVTLS